MHQISSTTGQTNCLIQFLEIWEVKSGVTTVFSFLLETLTAVLPSLLKVVGRYLLLHHVFSSSSVMGKELWGVILSNVGLWKCYAYKMVQYTYEVSVLKGNFMKRLMNLELLKYRRKFHWRVWGYERALSIATLEPGIKMKRNIWEFDVVESWWRGEIEGSN